ncbi:MAG TPA: alpha/beta fold hydrolase [Actinomycetota bacterium]|nr:alpha/beta fold hydrolase [Actinomycetota bacterium]
MTDRVVPGCESFSFDGGPIGILMLHGFTGNPASLRQMGEWLAARGHAVSCPRYPGHGTSVKDLERSRWRRWVAEAEAALGELSRRSQGVILFGLSMGGAMALHLAARHPETVRGLVLVNPYVLDRRIAAAFLIWPVLRSTKGIGNDIKKEGADELPYDRIPMRAVAEVAAFLKVVRSELSYVRQPLLVFNSPEDHVVPKGTAEFVLERAGSAEKEMVLLPNSYHVATIDNDAELIFERTHEFAEAKALAHGQAGGG